jgi:bifunctional UDP-N-acetylglucosamine pyrophosphorylase/glucosamine-1-phosphate N-acetyltransferase
MTDTPLACLILAAGKGTRMRSRLPKVLHEACGRPLVAWALDAVAGLDAARSVIVVPAEEPIRAPIEAALPPGAVAAVQERQRGTGDAVLAGREALAGFDGDVLVLYADTPLVDAATLRALVDAHRAAEAAATVLSIERTAETGGDFGRIVRDGDGRFSRIVEVRDAPPAERALTEVNSGMCVVDAGLLWRALDAAGTDNDQGELYLTDVFGILVADNRRVEAHVHPDATVAHGVNTRADLAEAARVLRARIAHRHMLAGVTIVDPATTHIDALVEIEADVTIDPFCVLRGRTRVAEGARVGPHVVAVDAEIGPDATVGPFCYLRPGTVLQRSAKAGTYVEIKNSRVGERAKVPHLSYIGDADIGEDTNIGAGNITANYDGVSKNRTTIGRNVRTSSDTVFVAPVAMGDGSWTAAGSVITDDVPPDALGIARCKQTNIEGYARRRRSPS